MGSNIRVWDANYILVIIGSFIQFFFAPKLNHSIYNHIDHFKPLTLSDSK